MPPKSQVDTIISELRALADKLSEVSDYQEVAARAKADLESLNKARVQAESEVKEAQALLTRSQVNAQKSFEQDMYNKQGQLKSLTERIDALEEQASDLTEEVRSKGLQLQSIESAFNDARRRLAG